MFNVTLNYGGIAAPRPDVPVSSTNRAGEPASAAVLGKMQAKCKSCSHFSEMVSPVAYASHMGSDRLLRHAATWFWHHQDAWVLGRA